MRALLNRLNPAALFGAALWVGAMALALVAAWGMAAAPRPPLLIDFYPPERNAQIEYQFARPSAAVLLPDPPPPGSRLALRVFSPAPLPPRELVLADVAGGELLRVAVGAEPRVVRLLLPPVPAGRAGLALSLRSEGAAAAGDVRELGLLYDDVSLEAGAVAVPWGRMAWALAVPALAGGLLLALGLGWPAAGAAALALALLAVGHPYRAGVALGALALAAALARRAAPQRWEALRGRLRGDGLGPAAWAVAGLVAAGAAILGGLALAGHGLYRTDAYDLGLYDQTFWLISRGLPSYSTAAGINMLGSHAALVLYPLSALYWLAPDVRLLLLFQALVVALGVVPLYLIGRDRGAPWLGVAAGAAYLLHPSVQNMALFDFHVDTIAATALIFALWAAEGRRWRLMLACCALVLACKENFAVTTAFLGLWLMVLRREWRVGAALIVASAAWFLFATQVLVPGLIGRDESLHVSRFSRYGDSVPAILLTVVTRPGLILGDLWTPEAPGYLVALLLPLGLLSLLSPYALLTLPGLAINLLSAEPLQRGLMHHYSALVVAALTVAALDTALRLRMGRAWAAAGLATLLLLAALLAQTEAPLRRDEITMRLGQQPPEPLIYDYLVSLIPPEAGVSAQGRLHPHLSHRRQAFLFPNPFVPADFFNPAGMPFAPDVEYVVYDTRRFDRFGATPEAKLDLLNDLRERRGYQQLASLDGIVLLRRR